MNKPLIVLKDDGKGKQLYELLQRELSIPETATEFTVTFKVGEIVKVNCVYEPTEKSQPL